MYIKVKSHQQFNGEVRFVPSLPVRPSRDHAQIWAYPKFGTSDCRKVFGKGSKYSLWIPDVIPTSNSNMSFQKKTGLVPPLRCPKLRHFFWDRPIFLGYSLWSYVQGQCWMNPRNNLSQFWKFSDTRKCHFWAMPIYGHTHVECKPKAIEQNGLHQ